VSAGVVYLTTTPALVIALLVAFGGSMLGLVVLDLGCVLAVLGFVVASRVVAHRRRTGRWDWASWRPSRDRRDGASTVRLLPSAAAEPLVQQWSRSRWPRSIEAVGPVGVTEAADRINALPNPGSRAVQIGVRATARRRGEALEVRLSRARPVPTEIEGVITGTVTGCRFEGWVFGGKGHVTEPALEMLQGVVPGGVVLFLTYEMVTNADPSHPVPVRLIAGFVVLAAWCVIVGWCHALRLLFGTADASWALEEDLAAVLDGSVIEVGDANPKAPGRLHRKPPARLGEAWVPEPEPTLTVSRPEDDRSRLRRGRRGRAVAIVLLAIVAVVGALFACGAMFSTGSAPVDPAVLPSGHPYWGYVLPDGTRPTYVDCPSFAQSLVGARDDLCASANQNSLIAVVALAIVEAAVVYGIVSLVRSRRRLAVDLQASIELERDDDHSPPVTSQH
jgi:hypothetical protein